MGAFSGGLRLVGMGLGGLGPAVEPEAFHLSPHGLHSMTPRRVAGVAHPRRHVVVLVPEHIAQVLTSDMTAQKRRLGSPRLLLRERWRTVEERRGVGAGAGASDVDREEGDDGDIRAIEEIT